MTVRSQGYLYLVSFILTVPIANWMIGNVGTLCPDGSPCLLPVGFDIMAPSGVLMVGIALVLRDLVQRRLGKIWALSAIGAGALLSALVAPAALVLASGVAFFVSEFADFLSYKSISASLLTLDSGCPSFNANNVGNSAVNVLCGFSFFTTCSFIVQVVVWST